MVVCCQSLAVTTAGGNDTAIYLPAAWRLRVYAFPSVRSRYGFITVVFLSGVSRRLCGGAQHAASASQRSHRACLAKA